MPFLLQPICLIIIILSIKMNTSMYESSKYRSTFDSPPNKLQPQSKRMQSNRASLRKPIFQNSYYYTSSKKNTIMKDSYNKISNSFHHIQLQSIHDDFCGCEHNLVPCSLIQQLISSISEQDMRKQYQQLQSKNINKSKYELRRKYFPHLPSYYPQIYHAQLVNILANIEEELTIRQFITLAWIQYHAKYQHITYFLYFDLKKAQKPKKKFIDNLDVSLISYQVNFTLLVEESKRAKIPLVEFIGHYHSTNGANIIPLSQYGKFIKILLKKGYKQLKALLILLLTNKKQTLFDLLRYYNEGSLFRQKSRALLWQQFLQELSSNKR